jgi:Alpha/beta hydrolase
VSTDVARWDAWTAGNGVRRLFGLADDLDRSYEQVSATVSALADWRGAAAERALSRMRTASLRISRLAGSVRQAADAVRSGLPGVTEAAALAAGSAQSPAEATASAALAASVDGRIAAALAAVRTVQPAAPPLDQPPAAVAHWWIALPPDRRRQLMDRRPDLLGRLAGLPADVRDQANRRRLSSALHRLRAEFDRLRQALPPIVPSSPREVLVRSMLAIAEAADRTLRTLTGGRPPARLLSLELNGTGRVVIGLGDVDRADHVAVLVPGMGDDAAHGVPGTVRRAGEVLAEAGRQSVQSTAVVAWVGYAAPGWRQVPFAATARTGGRMLEEDLTTLAAGRTGDPAHVTLVGHSYGSTVVGAALQSGLRRADDLVLLGSPGVLADDVASLGLAGRHVYVGEAALDPVADLGAFGRDPGDAAFGATRIRVDAPPRISWRDRLLAAHSQYFDPGSESLRNIARVVVGRGSDASRPGMPA